MEHRLSKCDAVKHPAVRYAAVVLLVVLACVLYPFGDCLPWDDSGLVSRLYFLPPHLFAPRGKENLTNIIRWKRIFSEEDIDYDIRLLKYKKNNGIELKTSCQNLVAGWHRLMEDNHLSMIHRKCLQNNIPPEIVFLALAESNWNKDAASPAGAKGYWQFMPATARSYGLLNAHSDHRSHPERSTDAAIKLLKDNYNLTRGWDRQYHINPKTVSNNDRWLWAFWSYNSSPSSVAHFYKKLRGKPAKFSIYSDSDENANYVNKIFGIREALKSYIIKSKKSPAPKTPSQADTLYTQYLNTWFDMPLPERLAALEEIKRQYIAQKKPIPPDVTRQINYISKIL